MPRASRTFAWMKPSHASPLMRSVTTPARLYIRFWYCHRLRSPAAGSRCLRTATCPARSSCPDICTQSCRGSPVRCSSRSRTVTRSVASRSCRRSSGTWSRTHASQSSRPASAKIESPVAVNDLVKEQIGNSVSVVTGRPASLSRWPKPRSKMGSSSCTTAIAKPGMCHSIIARWTRASIPCRRSALRIANPLPTGPTCLGLDERSTGHAGEGCRFRVHIRPTDDWSWALAPLPAARRPNRRHVAGHPRQHLRHMPHPHRAALPRQPPGHVQ